MALDPKLRDVLDFLPCEPCLQRPSPDQEVLCSICHRLNRTVALKCQVSAIAAPTDDAPSMDEVEEARRLAAEKEAEFATLAAQREADEETLQAMEAEREALLSRQRDLEDRLLRLEAASHGGPLTFVDEGPAQGEEDLENVVEFTRVQLPGQEAEEELMEFVPTESGGWQETGAWTDEPGTGHESSWDDADEGVAWDDEEPGQDWAEPAPSSPAAQHEAGAWDTPDDTWDEPRRASTEPLEATEDAWDDEGPIAAGTTEPAPTWEDTHDNPDPWAETAEQTARAEAAPPAAEEPIPDDLDEKTRADLAELEAQLAELEQELDKRKRN